MTIKLVNTLPEEKWRGFVEQNPHGNIFHTPEMFQVFSCTRGYQPQLWAAVTDDRILALLLPVQINLKNGLLRPLTKVAVVYGGVLCAAGIEGQEGLEMLLGSYQHEVKVPCFLLNCVI